MVSPLSHEPVRVHTDASSVCGWRWRVSVGCRFIRINFVDKICVPTNKSRIETVTFYTTKRHFIQNVE